jgi:chromosome segregation ATPase
MVEEARAPVSELERAEIPWVVAYLREDIQDLRNEVRENRRSIERLRQDMDAKIEGLDAKIERLSREMSVQFRWVLGTMVAVGALIVAALKLWP